VPNLVIIGGTCRPCEAKKATKSPRE